VGLNHAAMAGVQLVTRSISRVDIYLHILSYVLQVFGDLQTIWHLKHKLMARLARIGVNFLYSEGMRLLCTGTYFLPLLNVVCS
jgi:hypothetical protein